MTLPVIDLRQGSLGQSIANIGQAVGGIIRPHEEERNQFNQFLGQTPGAAERLAQAERATPGFLKETFPFLPDDQIEQIKSIPETAEQGFARVTQEMFENMTPEQIRTIAQANIARMAGEEPEDFATLGPRIAAAEELATDEDLIMDVARSHLTGQTAGQEALDAFNAMIGNAAQRAVSALPIAAQDEGALRTLANRFFTDEDVQTDFRNRFALTALNAQGASADISARAKERSEIAQSERFLAETNVGTADTWRLFLYNTVSNARGKGLANGTVEHNGTQGDTDLLEVGRAFLQREREAKLKTISAARQEIVELVRLINRADSDGNFLDDITVRRGLVEQLNSAMGNFRNLSDEDFEVLEAFLPARGNQGLRMRRPADLRPADPSREALPRGENLLEQLLRDADPNLTFDAAIDTARTQGPAAGTLEQPTEQPAVPPPPVAEEIIVPEEAPTAEVIRREDLPNPAMFNFQQIDRGMLGPGDITNVETLMRGQAGLDFKVLIDTQPISALAILNAFNVQSDEIRALIAKIQRIVQNLPDKELPQGGTDKDLQ